jgi:hypothetical protein
MMAPPSRLQGVRGSDVGFALEGLHGGRRPLCRPCLDWSERRPHLAGTLGAALLERSLSKGLLRRRQEETMDKEHVKGAFRTGAATDPIESTAHETTRFI